MFTNIEQNAPNKKQMANAFIRVVQLKLEFFQHFKRK